MRVPFTKLFFATSTSTFLPSIIYYGKKGSSRSSKKKHGKKVQSSIFKETTTRKNESENEKCQLQKQMDFLHYVALFVCRLRKEFTVIERLKFQKLYSLPQWSIATTVKSSKIHHETNKSNVQQIKLD